MDSKGYEANAPRPDLYPQVPGGPANITNQPGYPNPPPYDQSSYPPPSQAYPPPSQAYPAPPQGVIGNAGGFTPMTTSHVSAATGPPVVMITNPQFGPQPMTITCPHCRANVTTTTSSEPGAMAWILGGILCLFVCWCCACVPCCIDSLKDTKHTCPNCNKYLGMHKGGM